MDYVLIIIFQTLGVLYRCGQTIGSLKKAHPEKSRKDIINTFFNEDWNTLVMSGVVLCTDLAIHYTVSLLEIDWSKEVTMFTLTLKAGSIYLIVSMVIAIVLGYKGQDLIYKWLGTAADRLDKEVSDKING